MKSEKKDIEISIGEARNHPPKKRHPYLIRMVIYLVLTLILGFVIISYLRKNWNSTEADILDGVEVVLE